MIDAPSSTPAAAADLKRERSVSPSAPDMHVEQETENRHHNNEPARSDSVASHIPCPAAPVNDAVSSVAAPEAKAAPSQTQAPASPAHHELDELSAQLHRGHSSHYAFGNVKQIAVTDHLVMLDGLTMLTGPATGPITPYQTEVRIADNPSPLLVASIWLANLTLLMAVAFTLWYWTTNHRLLWSLLQPRLLIRLRNCRSPFSRATPLSRANRVQRPS